MDGWMDVDEVGRVHPLFTRIRCTLLRYVRRVTRAVCLSSVRDVRAAYSDG